MNTTAAANSTRKLTTLAMLAAVSVVLAAAVHFPLLPAAPFLEYDPADIAIFIGAFAFGPWAGLGLTAVVAVIQGLTVSASSGPIGILMHFLATGSFVLAAGSLYQRRKTRAGAVLSLCVGVAVWTAVMLGCNLVFTPIFMGQPMEAVLAMLVPVILPFNLLKGGINALATYIVYKPVSRVVHQLVDGKA